MMPIGRVLPLLALTAFWARPVLPAPAIIAPLAQNSAPASNPSPAQSTAPATAGTTAQNAAPAPPPAPVQPIPFSHKQHAGTLKLPCEFCHATSRSGDTVAIPQAESCMQCHQTIDTGSPPIQRLAVYAKDKAAIPWVRLYELPSFVTFSHKIHLLHGATCQECHGPVAERVQLYKEADISMAGCIKCHQAKKASTDCDTCHTLNQ